LESGSSSSRYIGAGDQRPGQSHPLLLPAGNLAGITAVHPRKLYQPEDILHLLADFRLGELLHLQAESHVLKDGHMREQRVILKENADVAPVGRDLAHILTVHQNRAGIRFGKAGDHAQVVVLPQPLPPSKAIISPSATCKSISLTAVKSPNFLVSF
jgi:hypothetical protein